jgi:hypothetical protein
MQAFSTQSVPFGDLSPMSTPHNQSTLRGRATRLVLVSRTRIVNADSLVLTLWDGEWSMDPVLAIKRPLGYDQVAS